MRLRRLLRRMDRAAIVRPGDVLVVGFGIQITAQEADRVAKEMTARAPGLRVMIVDQVTAFAVYRGGGE